MIYGVGTDIVSVARIAAMLERYGETFVRRILAPEELDDFRSTIRPERFLAKRFAAKEALSKALGTGLRHPVSLHNISIGHDDLGKPSFHFAPRLLHWMDERGIAQHHLSISDEHHMASAFVILEK
ncbi:MAG: holo-ACP synthase [Burkholderiales bacterium]|nr:holo-ACP synthase [Sulfuricellaceae bacterium]